MASNPIDDILAERKSSGDSDEGDRSGKCYSILVSDGYQENFLEIEFRDGLRTCFAYADLNWFNYDPEEGTLDLEFGGFLVSLLGRGLGEKLFRGIKSKRVNWVKEADSDFEDNDSLDAYIEQILITPPEGFGEPEDA